MNKMITPTFDDFMNNIVVKLPQAQHIKEEDARVWFNSVMKNDPDRFDWHVKRLEGIGGSDIGAIVTSRMGEYNPFKTQYDVINDKLLRNPVEEDTRHTRWGKLMEEVSRELFHQDFKCQSNLQLIEQINNHVSEKHPWMRNNVDEVVNLGGPRADPNVSGVLVGDFKNPTAIPLVVETPYQAQVTQYHYALEESGFKGPVVRAVIYTDTVKKGVVVKPVDLDPEILKHVLQGGDDIWNHIITDTKPKFSVPVKRNITFDDESKEKLQELEEQIAKTSVLVTTASDRLGMLQEEFKKELQEQADGRNLKGETLPTNLLSISVRQKILESEMDTLIESQQLNKSDFQKITKKFNDDKVTQLIQESGGEVGDYLQKTWDAKKIEKYCDEKGLKMPVQESISISFKGGKKQDLSADDIQEIHANSKDIVHTAIQDISLNPSLELSPLSPK